MVSIIICSRKAKPDAIFIQNIEETIGCPYEVISIKNNSNSYSIFSAYNLGATQSKYDILCFMHDDILFKTYNWGIKVSQILSETSVGVIGVAGAVVKTKSPSPWWIANGYNADEFLRYNIVQKRKDGWKHEIINPKTENLSEVVVLDGVWLCCRRDVWEKAKFDEQLFSGFHFYDLDFCLSAIAKGYKNYVVQNILIEHNSTGTAEEDWLSSAEVFHKKWALVLPLSVGELKPNKITELEYQAQFSFVWLMVKHNYGTLSLQLKLWLKLLIQRFPNRSNWRQLYCLVKNCREHLV